MVEWIVGRVQQLFSTEFILAVIVVFVFREITMAEQMTAAVAGAFGGVVVAIGNYAWQRTRQKSNGK